MSPERSELVLDAEVLARAGRSAKAVSACFEAIAADVGDPMPSCLLAELLLGYDCYDEAIAHATRAIESDPDCAPAYLTLGLAYDRRGGMSDQSILVWNELAEVAPDLTTAHVQLGEAFSAANFEDEAIDAWDRALEIDPREARAMYDLAVSALKREGVGTALPGFRKAGELDPSQDALFLALAARDPDERVRAAVEGGAAEDLFSVADAARAILGDDPGSAGALALSAWVYLKQEASNEAVACAARALQLEPGDAAALYCLGVAFARRSGLGERTADVFARLASAVPGHPMPHVLFAETLLGLQRFAEAGQAYRRAVALDPTCVRARFGLAAAYLTEGRHADAAWEIRRAAYHDTRRQGLFWRLYDVYAQGGDAT